MINLLIWLVIWLVVLGAIWYIVDLLPLPDPFARVIQILIVVIGIVLVLYLLMGVLGEGGPVVLRR
jgi:hypothetical protein